MFVKIEEIKFSLAEGNDCFSGSHNLDLFI